MQRFLTQLSFSLLLALSLSSQSAWAALTASIDRSQIGIDDTFSLVLRSDKRLSGKPDLSSLETDFQILGQNQSSNYSIINGKASTVISWNIQLAPKRVGRLNIPSIYIDSERSLPLSVIVSKAQSQQHKAANDDYFLDLSLSSEQVYQQAELIVSLKLYTRVGLQNIGISEFEPKNAQLQDLGDNNYNTKLNGRSFRVIEKRWALYPQQAGTLNLPSITLQAAKSGSSRGFFGRSNVDEVRLRSPAKTLTVLAIPDNFNGQFWLPAKSLNLSESWSQDPDNIKVGDSITRTINTEAVGLSAEQLIPLEPPQINGAKLYPDQAKLDNQVSDQGNQAQRQDSYAIIATQAGTIELPAITVHWWDIVQGVNRTASLPKRVIQVSPQALQNNAPAPIQQDFNQQTSVSPPVVPLSAEANLFWPITSLVLLLAWLVTLFFYWRLHQQKTRPEEPVIASKTDTAAIFKQLINALNAQQANSRELLISWAQEVWPQLKISALADFKHSPLSPASLEQLNALDRHLYQDPSQHWDGQVIANELSLWQQQQQSSSLAPLN